jgi:tetratricopeptide (TPR) repeat protein
MQVYSADRSNVRAQLGLALCSFHDGNWQSAVTQAQAALVSGGTNFAVLFLLGRAAKLAGDAALAQNSLDAAEKVIQKSVELNPDQPECHYLRGEVCFVRDQIASALEHYRAADDRVDGANPDRVYTAFGESFGQADVWAKLGLCYQRLGKLDRAREIGARIVAQHPDHKLGRTLSALGSE